MALGSRRERNGVWVLFSLQEFVVSSGMDWWDIRHMRSCFEHKDLFFLRLFLVWVAGLDGARGLEKGQGWFV